MKTGRKVRAHPTALILGPVAATYKRWIGYVAIVALIALWQLCTDTGVVDASVTSDPKDVVIAIGRYFSSDRAMGDLAASGKELLIGFALSFAVGVAAGVMAGLSEVISATIDPFVNFLNAVPRVALAPLFVIWFGIGLEARIVVVFLSSVFPIFINAAAGVRSADPHLPSMVRAFGGRTLFVIRHVLIPASVPSIAAGARIGIANAITGVVVAELIASTNGVGNVIISAGSNFEPSTLMVGVLILAVASLVLTGILRLIEQHVGRWRPQ